MLSNVTIPSGLKFFQKNRKTLNAIPRITKLIKLEMKQTTFVTNLCQSSSLTIRSFVQLKLSSWNGTKSPLPLATKISIVANTFGLVESTKLPWKFLVKKLKYLIQEVKPVFSTSKYFFIQINVLPLILVSITASKYFSEYLTSFLNFVNVLPRKTDFEYYVSSSFI